MSSITIEPNWTPGDWHTETKPGLDGLPDHSVFVRGRRICSVNWQSELLSGEREAFANATLIAAAPDLYLALAQIIEACHTTEYRDPLTHAQISDIANFALLKARGFDHYANLADGAPFADPEVE